LMRVRLSGAISTSTLWAKDSAEYVTMSAVAIASRLYFMLSPQVWTIHQTDKTPFVPEKLS
jgi:hypothetical protein